MNKKIYMDYAAATPVDQRVARVMHKYFSAEFANPSSIHTLGVSAKWALEDSRKRIAAVLNCRPSEIVFTSGGTEGDNLAIFGLAKRRKSGPASPAGGHIITSVIEHHAVLHPCQQLEQERFNVTYLPVSPDGFVNPDDVKKAIRPDTFLVSIMYANNEVGTIQPIKEIAKIIRRFRGPKIIFHTDACQASGALSLDVAKLGVDLMTISGAKIYGHKGVGVLFVKNGIQISPMFLGGGQERGLRSGTENVAGIVGLAKALELAESNREKESVRLTKLRNYFADSILKIVPGAKINGYLDTSFPSKRLPNNLNVFIPNIDNEQLVIELDAIGVSCSMGSACNSNEAGGSHVLFSLYGSPERNGGSVRFTLGRSTTKGNIDYVLKNLPEIMRRISNSKISPIHLRRRG